MLLYIVKLERVKNRKGDMQVNREQVHCRGRSRELRSFHSSILLFLVFLLRAFAVVLSLAVSSQPPGKKAKRSALFDCFTSSPL